MIRRCVNCDCELHKHDLECPNCRSTDLVRSGLFWYKFLGFWIGILLPSLINMILVFFFSDKRVKTDYLNPTILGRSKWIAARKGIIFGFVFHFVLLLLALFIVFAIATKHYFEFANLLI